MHPLMKKLPQSPDPCSFTTRLLPTSRMYPSISLNQVVFQSSVDPNIEQLYTSGTKHTLHIPDQFLPNSAAAPTCRCSRSTKKHKGKVWGTGSILFEAFAPGFMCLVGKDQECGSFSDAFGVLPCHLLAVWPMEPALPCFTSLSSF